MIIAASQYANIIGIYFCFKSITPKLIVASLHLAPAYTLFPKTDSPEKSAYESVKEYSTLESISYWSFARVSGLVVFKFNSFWLK